MQIYITNNFIPFTYFSMGSCKVYARLLIWYYGGDDFSACYEHANVFWELRTNQACGKGHGPPHCKLSNNKDCCCAADFCAAPRNSRAETTKFRKRLKTRGTWEPRGGIEAQFSKLAISKIFHQYWCYAHQYWWMLKDDLWYEQASGNILLKNNVWLNIFKKWL